MFLGEIAVINLKDCRFTLVCSLGWDSLVPTDNRSVRFCEHCKRPVHLCQEMVELQTAVNAGHCVAVMNHETNSQHMPYVIGEAKPIYQLSPRKRS